MNLVFSDEVARWVADRLGLRIGFGACHAMGVMDGDALIGGVVFNNYTPDYGVMEMTAFSTTPRWLSKRTMRAAFAVPFDENKCQLVVWRVSPKNTRTIDLAVRLGFQGHIIPRLRGRNEDDIIFTLTDDDWRASRWSKA